MKWTSAIVFLCCVSCRAQSTDTTVLCERFTAGVTWGISVPFGEKRSPQEDILQAVHEPTPLFRTSILASYCITPGIGIDASLGVDLPLTDTKVREEAYRDAATGSYPNRFLIHVRETGNATIMFTVGPMYRIAWHDAAIEAAIPIGYASQQMPEARLMMKEQGSNRYIDMRYETSSASSFVIAPAATVRYHPAEWRIGGMLRISYTHADFNHLQSVTEQVLDAEASTATVERMYRYRCLDIGVGMYWSF